MKGRVTRSDSERLGVTWREWERVGDYEGEGL